MPASSFVVHRLGEVGSTNTWLLAAARDGAPDRTAAVADVQSAGRGRLDRRWIAPRGTALLCSVLLRVDLEPTRLHLATMAVGLSARSACRTACRLEVGLKWPNDLVVLDRKLGGILAESDGPGPDGTTAVVVGLGLNLSTDGPPGASGTSVLSSTSRHCDRDEVLETYLDALDDRAALLATSEGCVALVDEYVSALSTLDRTVRVELAGSSFVGAAVAVTDEGHLVVEVDGARRTVAAGDVVHVRNAQGAQNPSE